MPRLHHFLKGALLTLAFVLLVSAQTATTTPAELSIIIGENKVKFTPLKTYQEMRLAVVNSVNELIYDSGALAEAELNWNLHDSNGQRLKPGLYTYTLSLKVPDAEAPRKHQGHFILEKGSEQIWLTTKGEGSVGAEVTGGELTVARSPERTTAGAGYVAAGRTLSERAGTQRDTQGRTVTDKKAEVTREGGQPTLNISGSGTTNRLTKWLDGPNGVVADSVIHETASGDLGIGTTTPGGVFDLQRNSASDVLQRFWNTGTGGSKLRYVASNTATAQVQFTGLSRWWSAMAATKDFLQFRTLASDDPTNTEAQLAASPRMTILQNGNVGIGTTAPDPFRLTVLNAGSNGLRVQTDTAGGALASFGGAGTFNIDAPGIPSGRLMVLENGNVGMGTPAPLAKLQVVTANDTNPSSVTAWDTRHFVVGGAASSGGIGLSYDQNNQVGHIYALSPNVAWRNLVLQPSGGNVGIGTTTPGQKLFVDGGNAITRLGINSSAPASNAGVGLSLDNAQKWSLATVGADGDFQIYEDDAGVNRLYINGAGANQGNIGIGTTAPGSYRLNVNNAGSDGLRVQTDTAGGTVASFGGIGVFNIDAPGDPGGRLTVRENGNVGIGIIPLSWAKLHVNGQVCAANVLCVSDARLKTQVTGLRYGLRQVMQLRPVSWKWKDETEQQLPLGLIAQEVQPVMPELVMHPQPSSDLLGLNYMGLLPVMVKAIQEQQAQIQQLLQANQQLRQRLSQVERRSRTQRR